MATLPENPETDFTTWAKHITRSLHGEPLFATIKIGQYTEVEIDEVFTLRAKVIDIRTYESGGKDYKLDFEDKSMPAWYNEEQVSGLWDIRNRNTEEVFTVSTKWLLETFGEERLSTIVANGDWDYSIRRTVEL